MSIYTLGKRKLCESFLCLLEMPSILLSCKERKEWLSCNSKDYGAYCFSLCPLYFSSQRPITAMMSEQVQCDDVMDPLLTSDPMQNIGDLCCSSLLSWSQWPGMKDPHAASRERLGTAKSLRQAVLVLGRVWGLHKDKSWWFAVSPHKVNLVDSGRSWTPWNLSDLTIFSMTKGMGDSDHTCMT